MQLSTYPIHDPQIPNLHPIEPNLHKPEPALALAHLLVFNQRAYKRRDRRARRAVACGPEGDEGAVVGAVEQEERVQVGGRADGREDAVLVGALRWV